MHFSQTRKEMFHVQSAMLSNLLYSFLNVPSFTFVRIASSTIEAQCCGQVQSKQSRAQDELPLH